MANVWLWVSAKSTTRLQGWHPPSPRNARNSNFSSISKWIPGYKLITTIHHEKCEISAYGLQSIKAEEIETILEPDNNHRSAIKVGNLTIVSVYKPPETQWSNLPLPQYSHPAIIIGDFNSHHTNRGYVDNSKAGAKKSPVHGRISQTCTYCLTQKNLVLSDQPDGNVTRLLTWPSAGLTIVANVAIATGPALLGAPQSSATNLIHYIIYKNLFSLRSQEVSILLNLP